MSGEASPVETDSTAVIGIAFGNTTSSIAYTTPDGKAEVIANEEGDRQIPTVLSYIGAEEFHGAQAKSQLVRNASNTVAYFRDFLGKSFASIDPTNCHYSAHPVEVDGHAAFSIKQSEEGDASPVTVSEMTTRHLRRLRDSAADFLGKKITGAVITVPTDFTDAQREALVGAAKAADLDVLQIIHEPAAAVLAYAAKEDLHPHDKTILVLDVGGTRSDAAVVSARGGMYTILATAHDYELGGLHLDNVLVDHFAKEFIKKHKTDPRENPRGLAKLKLEAEQAKRTLSLATTGAIAIESLADGIDFHSTINRLRYELSAVNVFNQIVSLAENAVKKAELDLLDIDEVILSGGSSHTPKIATRISQLFPESVPVRAPSTDAAALNPSELSARGAAIQASMIADFEKEDVEQSAHPAVTVAPHLSKHIGVVVLASPSPSSSSSSSAAADPTSDSATETFQPLLPAQTAVPARRIAEFPVPPEGGDVVVRFVEGCREIVTHTPEKMANGEKAKDRAGGEEGGEGSDEDSEDEDEEDEEEVRSKVLKVDTLLAEALLRGVKKGQKIEVTVNVAVDLTLNVAARIVGTQQGVRGQVKAA